MPSPDPSELLLWMTYAANSAGGRPVPRIPPRSQSSGTTIRQMPLPPGPRLPAPLQSLAAAVRPTLLLERAAQRYGDTFTLHLTQVGTVVVVSAPDDVGRVFDAQVQELRGGPANVPVANILGRSDILMLLDAEPHRQRRRLLAAPIGGAALEHWQTTMRATAEAEVAAWAPGVEIMRPRMQRLTLEVILRVVFGLASGPRLQQIRSAILAFASAATNPAIMLPLGRRDLGRRSPGSVLHQRRRDLLQLLSAEMNARRGDPTSLGEDVLSTLLMAQERGAPISDEALATELLALLGAGHETTATSLCWAFDLLSRRPECWNRIAREDEEGTSAFTDAVITEVLRLFPPLPMVLRRVVEPLEVAGYTLPVGVLIAACSWLAHRRPQSYPDPQAFRPERFVDCGPPSSREWFPFGGGSRRCVGIGFARMEMRAVLSAAARRYSLGPVRRYRDQPRRRALVLAPSRGGLIELIDRRS